jgi:rhamnose utilization protein RhaD (predicted bifunctional aldolase and dehydrogenase)
MRASLTEYCASIGPDPLLVQGAGGNVSWKDNETLWIKASGAWLADAAREDIFVPVDLRHLQEALAARDFNATPRVRGQTVLRPSIETLLHALMPHPVVIHLHPVEVLAHLVRHEFETEIGERIGNRLRWVSTGYHKPGAALAGAVSSALGQVPDAQVVLLQNHGVVIGGRSVSDVDDVLRALVNALAVPPPPPVPLRIPELPLASTYIPVADTATHQLGIDPALFSRLASDWALYPDHVVFLGARPACYTSIDAMMTERKFDGKSPELAFVRGVGVFVRSGFSLAKQVQLRCYYDVLCRQTNKTLNALQDFQIAELLNWDAEQYRMNLKR